MIYPTLNAILARKSQTSMFRRRLIRRICRPSCRGILTLVTAALLVTSTVIIPVRAASGDLDVTFGANGKVTTGFMAGAFEQATSVAVQDDGKLVVAGFVNDADFNNIPGVARYNVDGSLDSTFGSGGEVAIDGFFNYVSTRVDVALQTDGKIVIVSGVGPYGVPSDFGLVRLNADGTPDNGFGVGGKVTTDFFGSSDIANSVAIQGDGKIVVAGGARGAAGISDFAMARYDASGNLDSTFGVGGKLTTDFNGAEDVANGVAIQSDGKIVAAGEAAPNLTFQRDFAVTRYNADGTLDLMFDGDGKITTDIAINDFDSATSVAIQGDGKLVVAGGAVVPNNIGGFTDFAIVRYDTAGTPDPGFGNGGIVLTDFSGAGDFANDVVLQSDGKIVAAGYVQDPADVELIVDFGLARYDSSGNLDLTFGTGGKVITDFGGSDYGEGVALTPDCKIVAVGWDWQVQMGDIDFALARYNSDGCVVSSFECPLSQGYWKNASLWPVNSLMLGSQSYSKTELLGILNSKTTGDASIILAQQLIAAKLNLANGSDPAPVVTAVVDADGLLAGFSGKLPYKIKSSSAPGALMTTDATLLANYNTGVLTPACIP